MNKRRTVFLSSGLPSMFVIFSILCMVILSLLALGTSRHGTCRPARCPWIRPQPIIKPVLMPLHSIQKSQNISGKLPNPLLTKSAIFPR